MGKKKPPTFLDLIFGTTKQGKPVTARFGTGKRSGHTLLSDGHKSRSEFTGKRGNRGHDHYDGRGGGTRRGKYTGYGS
jgi:hypothetical protein